MTSAVLPTDLADKTIAGKVKTVGENGPADGLLIARDGKMYVSSPQDNAIKVRDLSGDRRVDDLDPGRAAALAGHLCRGPRRHDLLHDVAHPGLGFLQAGCAGRVDDPVVELQACGSARQV